MSRRSGALFLVPLVAALVFALVTLEDRPWGQWMWTVDLVTGVTVLTGPVVAAAAAHLGWTQSRLDLLVATTVRGWRVPLRCAFQAWVWGALGFGLSVVVAVALTLLRPHGGPFPWWATGIGLPVLAVSALFGALLVRVFPSRVAVIAAGPAVFLVGAFGPAPYRDLLRHGPSTGSLAGLEIDPTVWLLQVGGLLAVGVLLTSGLVGAARGPRSGRQLAGAGVVGVLAFAALVATGSVLDDPGRQRLRLSGERPTECHGSAPAICIAASSRHALEVTATPFRRAIGRLASTGAPVPARYEEILAGYTPAESAGQILVGLDAASLRSGATSAATPAGCPQWSDPETVPEKALEVRELIVEWVRVREGEQVTSFSAKGDRWLAGSATPEAAAWVRTAFARLRSCDFTGIRLPWSAAAAG